MFGDVLEQILGDKRYTDKSAARRLGIEEAEVKRWLENVELPSASMLFLMKTEWNLNDAQYDALKKARKPSKKVPEATTQQVEIEPEEAKPEEAKPEQAKPEQAKPEEAKPEEAKPEEAKPEEAKPEEAKLPAPVPAEPVASPPLAAPAAAEHHLPTNHATHGMKPEEGSPLLLYVNARLNALGRDRVWLAEQMGISGNQLRHYLDHGIQNGEYAIKMADTLKLVGSEERLPVLASRQAMEERNARLGKPSTHVTSAQPVTPQGIAASRPHTPTEPAWATDDVSKLLLSGTKDIDRLPPALRLLVNTGACVLDSSNGRLRLSSAMLEEIKQATLSDDAVHVLPTPHMEAALRDENWTLWNMLLAATNTHFPDQYVDLRGRDFVNKALTDASFRACDLRGVQWPRVAAVKGLCLDEAMLLEGKPHPTSPEYRSLPAYITNATQPKTANARA